MARKREFGDERPSSRPEGKTGQQDLNSTTNEKPDNIDSLVSSFLAELTDISAEVNHSANPGIDPEHDGGANKVKIPPNLELQHDLSPGSDLDLVSINDEIELSLIELENLLSAKNSQKESSQPAAQAAVNQPAAESLRKTPAEPAITPLPSDSGKQAWKGLETFRNDSSSPKTIPRQLLVWFLLIGILMILTFYLFKWNRGTLNPEKQVMETKKSQQAIESSAGPVSMEPAMASPDLKKSSRTDDVISIPVQEHNKNKPIAKNAARKVESGGSRIKPNGSPTAGSGLKPPAEISNRRSSLEEVGAVQEPPRQVAVQSAPAITAPVSSVAASSTAATQPKPVPVIPTPLNTPAESGPAAPVSASAQEIPPAAPKTAPAANADAGNTSGPLKIRKPVPAEVITKVPPEYPALAKRQRIAGIVEVEVDINEKGNVVRAKAISGPILLRGAAEGALMKWKFKAASIDGVDISSQTRISVVFNLQ